MWWRALACALLAAAAAPATALGDHSDLAGQWHLDEVVAGPGTPDSSGHGLAGAVQGTAIVPGRFGNAFRFNQGAAVGDEVRVADSALLEPSALTAMAWVRATGSPGRLGYVVAKGAQGCTAASYALYAGVSGGLSFYVFDGVASAVFSPDAGPGIWDGAWHGVAGTYDGSTVRLYVDGREVGTGTAAVESPAYGRADDTLTIGNYPAAACRPGGGPFKGAIDEVRIYGRALAAQEIRTLQGTPEPPPPPPGEAPRNIRTPHVEAGAVPRLYVCDEGEWEQLGASGRFEYRWYQVPTGFGKHTVVSQSSGYLLPRSEVGNTFYCVVTARNQFGAGTAASPWTLLSGAPAVPPIVRGRPYGNFRVRGIDLFQTVQPSSGAQMYGFPSGAFPDIAGGGTPTNYRPGGIFGAQLLPGTSAQRVDYDGVSLDADKRATAVVYVNMSADPTPSPGQPLEVTLAFRHDGRRFASLTQEVRDPPVARLPFVTSQERDDPRFGVQFAVPASVMRTASLPGRFDVEADVAFPTAAQLRGARECDVDGCHLDNRFRLDGVPVFRLPSLSVQTLLLRTADRMSFPSPEIVLAEGTRLFPGGDVMSIRPYAAVLDVAFEANLSLADHECTDLRFRQTRDCRQYYVGQRIERWYWDNAPERQDYDLLFGVHSYSLPGGGLEPGWKWGPGLDAGPGGVPKKFTANDGSAGRAFTAAAHELGHVMSAPHTEEPTPGACQSPGGPEPWLPDRAGRLQGVAFGRSPTSPVAGRVDPVVDTAASPLFDLLSYCASEANAWLSARNWNRAFQTLLDFDARGRSSRLAAAAPRGTAFAVGTIGPGGGRIERVVPPDGRDEVPPDVPGSPLRLRALDSAGRVLQDLGIAVQSSTEAAPGTGTFVGAVPPGAATVELVRAGAVLHRLERSRPPRVRLTSPRHGVRVRGRAGLAVRWSASDPDGDPLQAGVDYSSDGGRTWRTVFEGPSKGAATVPGRLLAGSSNARVRVVVGDGFAEARALSPRFRADGTAPIVRIVRPVAREPVRAGERTLLSGVAFDDRRRALTGRSLTWYAGRRRLGHGERLLVRLRPGSGAVRLQARDRLGRRSVARRGVRVAAPQLRLLSVRSPLRVRRGRREATVRVCVSSPATLRLAGRRYRIDRRCRSMAVPLPRRPQVGLLRIPLTIDARGREARGRIRSELQVLRT